MGARRSQRLRAKSGSSAPNDQIPKTEVDDDTEDEKTGRTRATVYDAVAGRVKGRLIVPNARHHPNAPSPSGRIRDPACEPPLAPEEVLFRRRNAPQRYAEKDVYFAGTDALAAHQRLPGSDLLKAVHAYAAGFYEGVAVEQEGREGRVGRLAGRLVDERSLDETALMAMGILLEEAGREALGRNGDMVFTEGVDTDGGEGSGQSKGGRQGKALGYGSGTEGRDESSSERSAKRRRLSPGSEAG